MNALALAAALTLAQAPAAPEPEPAAPAPAAEEAPPSTAASPPTEAPPATAAPPATSTPPATATPTSRRSARPPRDPTSPARTEPVAGRAGPSDAADAERAAREFLEALARGDATALARAASERFSFDGDVVAGREAIQRSWRDLLAARPPAAPPPVGALEVLQAGDATTRFGKPPARLAGLVRHGVTIAIGDVGGRTVVLFVAREGGRMAVLGMHD